MIRARARSRPDHPYAFLAPVLVLIFLGRVRSPQRPFLCQIFPAEKNLGWLAEADVYYTAHLWRGVYVAPGAQYIVNPGYNRDRGPVVVGSCRAHLEF